ncbi:MAG: hypothetical protein ACOYEV_10630 [Candidatus Nanopelagicales bacterium]
MAAAAGLPVTLERRLSVLAADGDLPPRTGPRVGVLVVAADTDGESDAAEPVDPPEPVVSANAIGTAAIAEPTPNATANAPTRPTYRA